MNKIKISLKKRQGSAIILTLVVVLLLTLLGVAAMGMSLSNLKMGAKVEQSTEDYYGIDAIGEAVVGEIDLKLKAVEDVAIRYLRYELFTSKSVTQVEADALDTQMADILYSNGATSSKKFEIGAYLVPHVHDFFYNEWKNNVYEPSKLGAGVDYDKYDTKMDLYYKEAFNRVYMYHAEKILTNYSDKKSIEGKEINYVVDVHKKKNKDYTLIGSSTKWKDYEFDRDDFIAEISILGGDGKTLNIELAIAPPVYSSVSQIKTTPIFGSRAVINAVHASDLEIEGNEMAITGDIVVKNKVDIKKIKELNIYGNVTAGSQLTATAEDNEAKTVCIKPYPSDFKQLYKDSLFGSNIFYEFDNNKLDNYIEKNDTDYKVKPILLFKENKGGNLIAGEVRFERQAKYINFSISNNAVIRNSLILAAEKDTKIKIGKHLVMTNSYVSDSQPGSICFITGLTNRIQLDGAVIIPGSYSGNIDERNYDFAALSMDRIEISDKLGELEEKFIEREYLYLSTTNGTIPIDYDVGFDRGNNDIEIYGYSFSPMILKKQTGLNYYLPSNYFLFDRNWIKPKSEYKLFDQYKTAVMKFENENFWDSYITRRTASLGFKDFNVNTAFDITALKEADGYMDSSKTQVKVFKSGEIFKLDEDFEGIIYGLGDLTIKGPRTIKGAVIVNGKLTLMGNTNIKYDETVLLDMQRKNKFAQAFLQPGKGPLAIDYLKEDTLSPKVRTATDGDRFKVKTWKIK